MPRPDGKGGKESDSDDEDADKKKLRDQLSSRC